jgi:hypothetical protein
MIPKAVKRHIRPLWIATLVSAGWANRVDVRRWLSFLSRAVRERETRSMSEVVTEAKVRAAITIDPVLRRDPSLTDVSVRDGVVTLMTAADGWPSHQTQISRLKRVKGVADLTVHSTTSLPPTPADLYL